MIQQVKTIDLSHDSSSKYNYLTQIREIFHIPKQVITIKLAHAKPSQFDKPLTSQNKFNTITSQKSKFE